MTFRNELKTNPTHILIPQGMLLDELNHGLSIKAFTTLTGKEGKTVDLNKALPLILAEDRKLKAGGEGGLSKPQFIAKLRDIFDLTKIDDKGAYVTTSADICNAWSAMLGDLSKLQDTINTLVTQHPDKKLILMSGTNPIHMETIQAALKQEEKIAEYNPLQVGGLPLYVSYLQQATDFAVRCQENNLIEEIMADAKLEPSKTLLLVSLTSQSPVPPLKASQEAAEKRRKEWAEGKGIQVIDFNRANKLSVADTISQYLATLQNTESHANARTNLFNSSRRFAVIIPAAHMAQFQHLEPDSGTPSPQVASSLENPNENDITPTRQ
jgi:hypothetical protein